MIDLNTKDYYIIVLARFVAEKFIVIHLLFYPGCRCILFKARVRLYIEQNLLRIKERTVYSPYYIHQKPTIHPI